MSRRSRREIERWLEQRERDDSRADSVPDIRLTRTHVDSDGDVTDREERRLEWTGSEWTDDDGYTTVDADDV